MWVVFGTEYRGIVEETDSSCIATEFGTLYWMPFFPIRSVCMIQLPDGTPRILPLPRPNWRSIILGWDITLFPFVIAALLGAIVGSAGAGLLGFPIGLVIGLIVALVVRMKLKTRGAFDMETDARRRLRSRWVGAPIEVAWGMFDQQGISLRLNSFLLDRGRGMMKGYRDATATGAFANLALTPEMTDGEYMIAAATYTELQSLATPGTPDAANAIWERVFTLYPETREAAPWFPALQHPTSLDFERKRAG